MKFSLSHNSQTSSSKDAEAGRPWWADSLHTALNKTLLTGVRGEIAEEIRLRVKNPLLVRTGQREFFLDQSGHPVDPALAYVVTGEDLACTLERMTGSSFYAAQENLAQGYLTLPGGHRVGLTGQAMVEKGKIRGLKHITGLNIRLAREQALRSEQILGPLLNEKKEFCHTLLISPPRAGKTTLLRALIRSLSDGVPALGLAGQNVGVVDERGELAGMWQGNPAFQLGYRTDVLEGAPKDLGLRMLVRSMSPAVVAVDELGGEGDVAALEDCRRSGVKILATAHGSSLEDVRRRPLLASLFQHQVFERIVLLSRRNGPGTVEQILRTGEHQEYP